MMMKMMLLQQLLLLMVMTTETLSQSTDVIENIQSAFSECGDYKLLMMLVVMCGAGLVGIICAVVHVIRPPPLFTLRSAASSHVDHLASPPLKLFDRIEEFH